MTERAIPSAAPDVLIKGTVLSSAFGVVVAGGNATLVERLAARLKVDGTEQPLALADGDAHPVSAGQDGTGVLRAPVFIVLGDGDSGPPELVRGGRAVAALSVGEMIADPSLVLKKHREFEEVLSDFRVLLVAGGEDALDSVVGWLQARGANGERCDGTDSGVHLPATVEPALRELQEVADRVYGRLEPERAVAWTLEELGELAQAMRRASSSRHLEEELGQLFAWVLCLANINGVDLGRAIAGSIGDEVERQMAKYGELRPYGGGRRSAPAGAAEGPLPPR